MTRLEANRQIIRILSAMVEAYPNQRFGQIMRNIDLVNQVQLDAPPGEWGRIIWEDEFNLESEALLKRIHNTPLFKGI